MTLSNALNRSHWNRRHGIKIAFDHTYNKYSSRECCSHVWNIATLVRSIKLASSKGNEKSSKKNRSMTDFQSAWLSIFSNSPCFCHNSKIPSHDDFDRTERWANYLNLTYSGEQKAFCSCVEFSLSFSITHPLTTPTATEDLQQINTK